MANPTMEIVSPGLLTTVQDMGRTGYQRYGIPVCGALDSVFAEDSQYPGRQQGPPGRTRDYGNRTDDQIYGKRDDSRLSEPIWNRHWTAVRCLTWESVYAEAGSVLGFGMPQDGLRAYLAIAGGIEAPLVMKSRSTDLKGGVRRIRGTRTCRRRRNCYRRFSASWRRFIQKAAARKSAGRLLTANTSI